MPHPLFPGRRTDPIIAKSFREGFNIFAEEVANGDEKFAEEDGIARIYIKFANGRFAVMEPYDPDDAVDEEDGPRFVHEVTHQEVKKHWTSIIAAIVLNIAFKFTFKNSQGDEVHLRFSKFDSHISDDFCDGIVAAMQVDLEFSELENIRFEMEKGFKKLEKLIKLKPKQSGT
ncbi:MAG: hypothetical protein PHT57_16755 [Rhodoferax sp.]|nr:hypothetical protein [Rhodoferax sp.]